MVGGSDSRRNRTAIVSSKAKQWVRNSVAIFVWIPGLRCRMIHLKYGINKEAPCVAVIAAKGQHFADGAATWLALGMDNCGGYGPVNPHARSSNQFRIKNCPFADQGEAITLLHQFLYLYGVRCPRIFVDFQAGFCQ